MDGSTSSSSQPEAVPEQNFTLDDLPALISFNDASSSRLETRSRMPFDMREESMSNLEAPSPPLCRISRVPEPLRKKHAKMFEPEVVAIGPYHRNEPHLSAMEDRKRAAAGAFASLDLYYRFCQNALAITAECRAYYDGPLPEMSDGEFAGMLFVDGCFVLQFINQIVENKVDGLKVSAHLQGFILRDMFLLENQLPYVLLEKLMEVKSVRIDEFLDLVMNPGDQSPRTEQENRSISMKGPGPHPHPHPHLLSWIRDRQLGPTKKTSRLAWGSSWLRFRSAKELIEAGIKLRRGETGYLRDVKFVPGLVWAELSLPWIIIDDLTHSRLLNMIALEMCGGADGIEDYGITSFAWFMDMLIDHADDVKELRRAGALQNALGSDEQVAEMFNEIGTDLVPDQQAYYQVTKQINEYYQRTARVSLYTMLHTHFGTPWAAIAFLAAVVLLVLTVVQTVFTVLQTIYTIHPPTK